MQHIRSSNLNPMRNNPLHIWHLHHLIHILLMNTHRLNRMLLQLLQPILIISPNLHISQVFNICTLHAKRYKNLVFLEKCSPSLSGERKPVHLVTVFLSDFAEWVFLNDLQPESRFAPLAFWPDFGHDDVNDHFLEFHVLPSEIKPHGHHSLDVFLVEAVRDIPFVHWDVWDWVAGDVDFLSVVVWHLFEVFGDFLLFFLKPVFNCLGVYSFLVNVHKEVIFVFFHCHFSDDFAKVINNPVSIHSDEFMSKNVCLNLDE